MNGNEIMKSGISIERQLGSIDMPHQQRSAVFHAAHIAGMLVDAIVQACDRFARIRAAAYMKRGAYYWD